MRQSVLSSFSTILINMGVILLFEQYLINTLWSPFWFCLDTFEAAVGWLLLEIDYLFSSVSWNILGPCSLEPFPVTCKRNFLCLQMISLNFLEQLPLVEQYHAVNISSTWLDPERVIGQQLVSHDLFRILWNLLRRDKPTGSNELKSPNYSILFSMVFKLFLCGLDRYIYI